MKKFSHLFVFLSAGLLFALAGNVKAQQKIGYVDTDYILSNMPQYNGIKQQLESISKEWNNELKKKQEKISKLQKDFESKEILYTDELRKKKQQQIQQKKKERQQYMEDKFGAKGQYFQRQKELLEPIQRKVLDAVNTVAEQQGFDFVFDQAQNSSLLFGDQQWNLNADVLQELDITLNNQSN